MRANADGNRIRAFVGRTREFAALASALDAASSGRGTLCLINGEPGIGKSRLLTEFAAEQASRYPSIHWGFAWEAGGAPVYWPWIQILRSLLSRDYARATLHEQPHLAAPIAELVPELVPVSERTGTRLEPEQARFRLMDAVSSLLLACAAHEPQVELARSWEALGDVGYYAFNDVHALMAFLATGDQRHAKRMLEGLEGAARRMDTNGMMSRDVGLPMARALGAFEGQDYEIAADDLQRVRAFAQRFGGSHAQRDLLQLTTTEAAIRAGRQSLAHALIAERMALKPHSGSNLRLLERAQIIGTDEGVCAA